MWEDVPFHAMVCILSHLTPDEEERFLACCKSWRGPTGAVARLVHMLYHTNSLTGLTDVIRGSDWKDPLQQARAVNYVLSQLHHQRGDLEKPFMDALRPPTALMGVVEALMRAGAPVTAEGALKAAVCISKTDMRPLVRLLPDYTAYLSNTSQPLEQRAALLQLAAAEDCHTAVSTLLPCFSNTEQPMLADSLLLTAAAHGAVNTLHTVLQRSYTREGLEAALVEAARAGSVEAAMLVLQHGADVHAQQDSALRMATAYEHTGHKEVVKLLVSSGADVHVGHDTPLVASAAAGHVDVVQLLLQYGADPCAQSGAALVTAAMHGHTEVVRLLLEAGAAVNAQQGMPLIRAASAGHTAVISMLLAGGADVHAQYDAPLVAAARGGHLGAVQQLLAGGAHAAAEDNAALCAAVAHGHVDIIHLLLKHGADVRGLEDDVEAMCHAASHNHWAALEVVLRQPPCRMLAAMGPTLLAVAGLAGCSAVVALLLNMGAAEQLQPRPRGYAAAATSLPLAQACGA